MNVCLSLKTCKRKTYIEILSGFTVFVCLASVWVFDVFEKHMIVVILLLFVHIGLEYHLKMCSNQRSCLWAF